MWCGKDIVNRKTVKHDSLKITGALVKHLLACKGHPLARRIDELIKERKQLRSKITRLERKLQEEK